MIKQIFKGLSGDQQQQLMAAFEQEFASFVELPNGTFIGVHLQPLPKLKVIEHEGVWFFGEVIKDV